MSTSKVPRRENAKPCLSFVAEWYQKEAGIIRTFKICFYSADNAIEVFHDSRKIFLHRTKMPELCEIDFYIGSKINVFGRQFDIVDYGDEYTKRTLLKYRRSIFVLIKHTVMPRFGQIVTAFLQSDYIITKGLMGRFDIDKVREFLGERNKSDFETSNLMSTLISGPSMAFEMVSENAIDKLIYCFKQSKEDVSSRFAIPDQLYKLFVSEEIRTGVYCSQTEEDVSMDISYFFNQENDLEDQITLRNRTLAIVKPHCIKEGNLGHLLHDILHNGFQITAMRTHFMELVNCAEFHEIYRGVLPEYVDMVTQLASGICLAMEIACVDENKSSYDEFRRLCGPLDPLIGKLLHPSTLRAKYGKDKTMNAIHCTDLEEDTTLELQYMFKILEWFP